jgi:hypothetical protein
MSTTKPILLICGCRKYEDYLHAAIKRMSRPEWDVIGIRGGGETVSFDEEHRILTLDSVDTYEALPAKLHAAYTWIHVNRPGIPGIFKTDDDMLFDLPALAATVAANTKIPYWGVTYSICQAAPINSVRIMNRFDDKTLTPSHQSAVYCFGAGYWISEVALPHIVAASADYKGSALEDVCTGFVLNRAGIVPQKIPVLCKEVPRVPQLLALQ